MAFVEDCSDRNEHHPGSLDKNPIGFYLLAFGLQKISSVTNKYLWFLHGFLICILKPKSNWQNIVPEALRFVSLHACDYKHNVDEFFCSAWWRLMSPTASITPFIHLLATVIYKTKKKAFKNHYFY